MRASVWGSGPTRLWILTGSALLGVVVALAGTNIQAKAESSRAAPKKPATNIDLVVLPTAVSAGLSFAPLGDATSPEEGVLSFPVSSVTGNSRNPTLSVETGGFSLVGPAGNLDFPWFQFAYNGQWGILGSITYSSLPMIDQRRDLKSFTVKGA